MPATPSSGPGSTSPDVDRVIYSQLLPCWESDVLLLFLGTVDQDGKPVTFRLEAVAFQLFHN